MEKGAADPYQPGCSPPGDSARCSALVRGIYLSWPLNTRLDPIGEGCRAEGARQAAASASISARFARSFSRRFLQAPAKTIRQ